MTDHPCKGMTRVQRDTFEQIAISLPPRASTKTLEALLKRGAIEKGEDEVIGRDRFGVIAVPSYFVPLMVHAQWCEWCSEQPELADA